MKQFKKILCGVMLTSFVILGSVSIFAGPGDGAEPTPPPSDTKSCVQLIENTAINTVENSHYTEEVVVGDMNASAGYDWNFDPAC